MAVWRDPLEQQLEKQLPAKAGAAASSAQQVAGKTPSLFIENQCVKPDSCLDGGLTTSSPSEAQTTTSQGSVLQPLITCRQKTRNSQGCHAFLAGQKAALQAWFVTAELGSSGLAVKSRIRKAATGRKAVVTLFYLSVSSLLYPAAAGFQGDAVWGSCPVLRLGVTAASLSSSQLRYHGSTIASGKPNMSVVQDRKLKWQCITCSWE